MQFVTPYIIDIASAGRGEPTRLGGVWKSPGDRPQSCNGSGGPREKDGKSEALCVWGGGAEGLVAELGGTLDRELLCVALEKA